MPQGKTAFEALNTDPAACVASFAKVDQWVQSEARYSATHTLLTETPPAPDRLQAHIHALVTLPQRLADEASSRA